MAAFILYQGNYQHWLYMLKKLKSLEEKMAEVLFGYRKIILRVVICMATWLHLFAV